MQKLSSKEKKLLRLASDTGTSDRLTIEEIAERTGVSVDYVSKKMADPEFKGMFLEAVRSSLTLEVPAILDAFVQLAREGSYQHGKMILDIVGIHQEEHNINIKGDLQVTQTPFGTDEEKADFLRATLAKVIPMERSEEEGEKS